MASKDWNPGQYARFSGHRLRPALDLLKALNPLPDGPVIDLGCGNGAVGPALAHLDHRLVGIDSSETMLAEARNSGVYDQLLQQDIAEWVADTPPALIFSNAALQWLPDHTTLVPRLVKLLAKGGTLGVQMPHQNNAPSHRLWRSLAEEFFPGRMGGTLNPGVLLPAEYHRLLSSLGKLTLWETEYYQLLEPGDQGHPVRRFTEATYARPILQALEPDEQFRLIEAYESVIGKAYPSYPDGSVLFPFRRMFLTLRV